MKLHYKLEGTNWLSVISSRAWREYWEMVSGRKMNGRIERRTESLSMTISLLEVADYAVHGRYSTNYWAHAQATPYFWDNLQERLNTLT